MSVEHRWVQHANQVVTWDGRSHAGVMEIDGRMRVVATWDDEAEAIRIWRRLHREPARVCQLLGIEFADAAVVDVGRMVRQGRTGAEGWRIDRVVCEQARVLDRREPFDPPGDDETDTEETAHG